MLFAVLGYLVLITFIAVQGKAGTLHYEKLILGMAGFVFLLYLDDRAYKIHRARRANAE